MLVARISGLCQAPLLAAIGAVLLAVTGSANLAKADDPVAPYRAARDAFIEDFRVSGAMDFSRLTPLAQELSKLAETGSDEVRVRALIELGRVQRLQSNFDTAVATLTSAAQAAGAAGMRDEAFEAWMGIERAELIGRRDHGAAAAALEHAGEAAGPGATPKQRYEIASSRAEELAARGELEAGLVEVLEAVRTAPDPKDRFYAENDAADTLEKLAKTCWSRPLHDARSRADADPWGACRRALALAQATYGQAASTATELGWMFLAGECQKFQNHLATWQQLWDQRRVGDAKIAGFAVFDPKTVRDVSVSHDFQSGASTLSDMPWIADLINQVADAGNVISSQHPDPLTIYMRGVALDIRGGSPEQAAALFAKAATLLQTEREGFFDPRRRGTAIEGRANIVTDLAMRLLALGKEEEAFAAFESVRARGLAELAQILAGPAVTQADRAWLATLLLLEARMSKVETQIVETVIAEGKLDAAAGKLSELAVIRNQRRVLLLRGGEIRNRIGRADYTPASLAALQAAAGAAGVPVLLYWTTPVSVIVWYVGSHGSEVRSVFLPESALTEKAQRVADTSASAEKTFSAAEARELYLYLIAPFEPLLDAKQILIVPQGPLIGLPFETLLDPATDKPAIERWAVSYAPNATMALGALHDQGAKVEQLTAIVDVDIDDATHETDGIAAALGPGLRSLPSSEVLREPLTPVVTGAGSVHFLLHGSFDETEPLLSTLTDTSHSGPPITAATIAALPLQGLRLAVLSACESGRVGTRLSNEIYGFPWALLAAGVETAIVSRWVVSGDSNGKWMQSFYAAAAEGASPAFAAATAMRSLRAEGRTHPYYWAAMQVIGR